MGGTHVIAAASLAAPIERARELSAAAQPIGIDGADPWPEAGRKALRVQLARMLSRLPGVLAGDDPEDVHAMRVAARRMRAGWRVFGDAFERDLARHHRRELRALGTQLGAVRDLDVGLRILDGHLASRGSRTHTALLPVWNAWSLQRQERHGALVGYLAAPMFVAFVQESETFCDLPGTAAAAAGRASAPVRARMPAKVWEAYGHVRAFEGRLAVPGGPDHAVRHDLRIVTKWLRYTLELASEPIGADAALLLEPVVALQDHLGDQLDLETTIALARAFIDVNGTQAGPEVTRLERLAVGLARRVDGSAGSLPRAWSGVSSPRYRARLGRAMASL